MNTFCVTILFEVLCICHLFRMLQVSSIRESRSDDKRFSIFTGTKRLHMRAETQEDRQQWLEALHAVKGMFPRMSNGDLMAPIDNIAVSTEKLRQRLLEECVSEAAIQDSEQIMRNEFASLQNQLILVRQQHWLLIDTLRHLEVHIMTTKTIMLFNIIISLQYLLDRMVCNLLFSHPLIICSAAALCE